MSEKEFYKNQESMRKPSLTTFTRLVQPVFGNISKVKQILPIFLLLLVGQVFGQVTATFSCLGNATSAGTGQYRVTICYAGISGDTYEVTSLDHIYDDYIAPTHPWTEFTSFPIPLIEDGTTGSFCIENVLMQELANGVIYINNVGYVVNAPQYPLDIISGPASICAGTSLSGQYTLVGADVISNLEWTVTDESGGTITTTDDETFSESFPAFSDPADDVDSYTISVTGSDIYGCMIDASIDVEVYDLSDRIFIEKTSGDGVCGHTDSFVLNGPSNSFNFSSVSWTVHQTAGGGALATNTTATEITNTTATVEYLDGLQSYFIRATGFDPVGCTFATELEVQVVNVTDGLITYTNPDQKICSGGSINLQLSKDTIPGYNNDATWAVNGTPIPAAMVTNNGCDAEIDLSSLTNTNSINVSVSGTYGPAVGGCSFSDDIDITITDVATEWQIVGNKNPYCGDVIGYSIEAVGGHSLDCLTPLNPSTTVHWTIIDGGGTYTGATGMEFNNDTEFQVTWDGVTSTSDVEIVFSGETEDGCTFDVRYQFIEVRSLSNLEIQGDSYVCLEDDSFQDYCFEYTNANIVVGLSPYSLVDYNGVDVSTYLAYNSADRTKTTINWPDGAAAGSPYVLTLTGDTAGGNCGFTASKTIEVVEDVLPGQIACNNHVNITLNQLCDLVVTPDMILEGVEHAEEDRYEVTITDSSGDVVSGTLNGDHVGQTFQVMVQEDCSGNVCWGYITVEDKSIPQIVCPDGPFEIECNELNDMSLTGFPVFEAGVVVTDNNDDSWTVEGFDNCTDATLTYSDALEDSSCDPTEPGSTYRRTWVITDEAGSSSECSYLIEITRPSDLTLIWPLAYDSNIAGANASLDACDLTIPLDTLGNPHPSYTGYPTGVICLNLSIVGYEDVLVLDKCPDPTGKLSSPARKIIREWTIWDSCSGEDYTYNQIISLVDHTPPVLAPDFAVFGMEQDDEGYYLVDAHQYNCSDAVTLYPFPGSGGLGEYLGLIGECSDITMRVGYLVPLVGTPFPDLSQDFIMFPNDICDVNDNVTIPAVDGTAVWIRYEFEDACGNIAIAQANQPLDPETGEPIFLGVSSFEIRFEDNTPPQPVCDVYSVVALDESGCAYAMSPTFDDGSFDNCEMGYMKVIREDNATGNFTWLDQVKFDCDDVGVDGGIGVYLGVWDAAGNSSSCLVSVTVMDPIDPTVTCPANATVDCADDLTWFASLTTNSDAANHTVLNNAGFDEPTYSDPNSCSVSITEGAVTFSSTECGLGSVTRSWTIKDQSGYSRVCTQVITINNSTPFSESNINWPADELSRTCTQSIDPADIGEPQITTVGCSNVVMNYEDLPFQYVANTADYCQKVIRTWTVRDWCNPGAVFTHTQVIKIIDNDAPSFTNGCADVNAVGALNAVTCEMMVDGLAAEATDACTDSADLEWTYVIDYDNATGLDTYNGTGNDASGLFPSGRHTVTYYVSDFCGNVNSCMINVNVDDDVLPTPYCVDQVVTVINAATGLAEIWAADLDAGSYDNCFNNTGNVEVSFSANGNTDVLFYDCDDLENGIVDTFEVRLYVIDGDGNYDFCLTKIIVQDNSGICPDVPGTNGSGRIAGDVKTEDDEILEDVMMHLHASMPEFPMQEMTQVGHYDFEDLQATQNYMVTPSKNDNHANGVSTLDIILIQRHILNLQNLDSPYKLIAADANNNGNVSSADLVEIRNLILENINEYSNNSSWRFINKGFEFVDAMNPFPFEEEVDILNLPEATVDIDFVGVKVGDVNHSVSLNNLSGNVENRGSNPLQLMIQSTDSQNGQVMIPVKAANDYSLTGMQLELDVTADITDVASGLLQLNEENIKTMENGSVRLSWNTNTNKEIVAGDVLFTLVVNSNEAVDFNNVSIVSKDLSSEAYSESGNNIDIENIVLVEQTKALEDGFALYQNKPNPFSEATTFSFSLPQAQSATITIMEMTGKVLYSITDTYAKGYNEVDFNTALIQSTGILYLKVETETHSAIRKMIIIQ